MAEYFPLFNPGTAFTRNASAPITGGQLVVVSGSGLVAPSSGATPSWVGIAASDASVNDEITVYRQGVQTLTAGVGGITAGQTVEPAVNGTVVAHTNGTNDINVVGLALTTAAAGARVEVKFRR